jgi:hypothetical protein
MQGSLVNTLARKLETSPARIYARFHATLMTEHGPRRGFRVTVERPGKPPLVATWGGVSLVRRLNAVLDDQPPLVWNGRTELLERLLADTCELCGSRDHIEVHHVRSLKTLHRKGRSEPPEWMQLMAARHRKTLVTCHACHVAIHAGRPLPTSAYDTGEPDALKGARPVRRGVVGKVLPF